MSDVCTDKVQIWKMLSDDLFLNLSMNENFRELVARLVDEKFTTECTTIIHIMWFLAFKAGCNKLHTDITPQFDN